MFPVQRHMAEQGPTSGERGVIVYGSKEILSKPQTPRPDRRLNRCGDRDQAASLDLMRLPYSQRQLLAGAEDSTVLRTVTITRIGKECSRVYKFGWMCNNQGARVGGQDGTSRCTADMLGQW